LKKKQDWNSGDENEEDDDAALFGIANLNVNEMAAKVAPEPIGNPPVDESVSPAKSEEERKGKSSSS